MIFIFIEGIYLKTQKFNKIYLLINNSKFNKSIKLLWIVMKKKIAAIMENVGNSIRTGIRCVIVFKDFQVNFNIRFHHNLKII